MTVHLVLCIAVAATLGQAAHAADASAPPSVTPLSVARIGKHTWMLRDPLTMTFKDGAPAITVPAGFVTELGSLPKRLRVWDGSADASIAPAVFHDYLYWSQACARDEADAVMVVAMTALGTNKSKAAQLYKAVNGNGAAAFKGHAERRRAGEVRTFTPEYARSVVQAPYDANETLAGALGKAQAASGLAAHEATSAAVKLTCARLLYQCDACRGAAAKKKR
jgi:hypothetical protein